MPEKVDDTNALPDDDDNKHEAVEHEEGLSTQCDQVELCSFAENGQVFVNDLKESTATCLDNNDGDGDDVNDDGDVLESTDDPVHHVTQKETVWMTVLFATIASIPTLLAGCTLGFPSAALLDLTDLEDRPEYKFNNLLSDIFGAIALIGALFGGPVAGWIADHWGRKAALLLVSIPYLTGYMMIVYAHMIGNAIAFKVILLLGRFLSGLGIGWSCCASTVYTAETSSAHLRGLFNSFTQLFISVGLLVIYFLESFEDLQYYDTSLILIGILALYVSVAVFIPETPRWLLVHRHKFRAISVLKLLRGKKYNFEKELSAIRESIANTPHLKLFHTLKHLRKRSSFIPLLLVVFAVLFRPISGLSAITAYSAVIFKEAGVRNFRAAATYAIGGAGLIFTVIAMFIVDRFGRKILLLISGVGMLLGTLMLGIHFYITRPSLCSSSGGNLSDPGVEFQNSNVVCNSQYAPLAIFSVILFYAAFSIGFGPVPWILLGELLPLRVRGIGSGIANAVLWGTAALTAGLYFNYSEVVRPWFAWWTFSLFNLASTVFVLLFIFETKGKSLEEIQNKFEQKHSKNHFLSFL